MMLCRRHALTAISILMAGATTTGHAQSFPAKPVRIVVPYAAGANSDVLTRAIAQKVTEQGGPTFVIENKPGGGGIIGAMAARQAEPDGHTLFVANSSTHAILPALQKVPYDIRKDFQSITQLFFFPNFLVVPQRVKATSVREFVELAKTSGGMTFGSQGNGSPGHLLGAMLQQRAGIPLVHVPYAGGGGPMNVDVVAGRLDMVFSTYASLKSHEEQGKIRFLAIMSTRRSPSAPDIPTMAEIGFSGVELDAWFGLVAPMGVPAAVVSYLNEAFTRAARSPNLVERFTAQGVTLAPQTPAAFAEQIAREADRLGEVVRASGISTN